MKILHLVPGTGNFYCGACLRDAALVRGLRERGHDVVMQPLYLPVVLETTEVRERVRLGGINLFMQVKHRAFRKSSAWLERLLDAEGLLRMSAHLSGMTRARDLGEMTLACLQGPEGPQARAWADLIQWITEDLQPDVVSVSNSLISGVAGALKAETELPVVISLQGEDVFLDALPEPFREQAWSQLSQNAANVDRFVAPSGFYSKHMRQRLGLGEEKVATVPNGVDLETFRPRPEVQDPGPPSIGFLARLCHGKGLHLLVEAFIQLKRQNAVPDLQLQIAGACTPADRPFMKTQVRELAKAGVSEDVRWHPNVDLNQKVFFLQNRTVFSVPTVYPEAFGLYAAEALACGVPLVQPDHGAFPELVGETGAGKLVEPKNAEALAEGLKELLLDSDAHEKAVLAALKAAKTRFSADSMCEEYESVLETLA